MPHLVLGTMRSCWTATQHGVRRFLELNDTPERIARGAALGLFVSMTPTVGVQMPLILLVNTITRTNRLAGFIMIHINLFPLTTPAIYWADFRVGAWLLGQDAALGQHALRALVQFESTGILSCCAEFFADLSSVGGRIVTPMFLGGAILGAALAIPSYPLILHGVRRYRVLKAKAIEKAQAIHRTHPARDAD